MAVSSLLIATPAQAAPATVYIYKVYYNSPGSGTGSNSSLNAEYAFRQAIRDIFLGIKQPPLTSDEANDKRFRMARRRGYDVHQVDAFCDEAVQRLAQMQRSDK